MTTPIDINTYRRDADVVDDAYRLAVHQAGTTRRGKYEAGYQINSDTPEIFTPEAETEIAVRTLLSKIYNHGDSLRHVEISWKHTTKDGHTIYPTVTFTG